MPEVRSYGALVALGGRDLASIEVYDPRVDARTAKAAMTWRREQFGAAVVNGKIVVTGGCREHWENVQYDSTLAIDHVEQYDPTSNTRSALAPLPTGMVFAQDAVVDGILYVAGGWRVGALAYSQEMLPYSPATDTWTTRSPMPELHYRGACAVLDGEIYYPGGTTLVSGGPALTSTLHIYDPATDSWRRGPDMPATRTQHGAASAGGVLCVVGGADGGNGLSFWAYRPR